jgi:hypothetical protein
MAEGQLLYEMAQGTYGQATNCKKNRAAAPAATAAAIHSFDSEYTNAEQLAEEQMFPASHLTWRATAQESRGEERRGEQEEIMLQMHMER